MPKWNLSQACLVAALLAIALSLAYTRPKGPLDCRHLMGGWHPDFRQKDVDLCLQNKVRR